MASEYWESSALQILRLAEKSLGFRELKRWMGFLNKNDWENLGVSVGRARMSAVSADVAPAASRLALRPESTPHL